MNEVQRHNGILSLLEEMQTINVSHIIDSFSVSPATARRDIAKLDELGRLRKVRNGAERIENQKKQDWFLVFFFFSDPTPSLVLAPWHWGLTSLLADYFQSVFPFFQ